MLSTGGYTLANRCGGMPLISIRSRSRLLRPANVDLLRKWRLYAFSSGSHASLDHSVDVYFAEILRPGGGRDSQLRAEGLCDKRLIVALPTLSL